MNVDKEILNKFMQAMLDVLKSAKDFTLEQAPDIMRQVVAFETARSAIWLGLWLTMPTAVAVLWIWVVRSDKTRDAKLLDDEDFWAPLALVSFGAVAVSTIGIIVKSIDLAKVLVAPKVYLLEYFAELVKK